MWFFSIELSYMKITWPLNRKYTVQITFLNAAANDGLILIQYHSVRSVGMWPRVAWMEFNTDAHAWFVTNVNSTNQHPKTFIFINSPCSVFISIPCLSIVLFFLLYLLSNSLVLSLLVSLSSALSKLSLSFFLSLLFTLMPSCRLGLRWAAFVTASERINAVLPLCADI